MAQAKPIWRLGMETGIFSWTSRPEDSSSRTKSRMTQAMPRSILANSMRRSMEVTSIIREAVRFSRDKYRSTYWRVIFSLFKSMSVDSAITVLEDRWVSEGIRSFK